MRSSFMGFEVSKRSLQISQKALDITNNNLSNISTTGYTRQRVDTSSLYLSATGKYSTNLAKLSLSGQGSYANGISQVRDPYVDKRYREYTAYTAEYDTKSSVLSDIESVLDDINDTGLISGLDDFKEALSKYAANQPDSTEMASVVRNEAYSICQMLNTYGTQLDNLLIENKGELQNSVSEVNNLIDKIVQYNGVITGEYNITSADLIYKGDTVVGSYGPNELIDERNNLLDQLSFYGDIRITDNNNGSVKVTMGGVTIIDDLKSEHMIMKDWDNYGAAVVKFTTGDNVELATGEIKAYQDLLNGNGPYSNYYQNSEYGIPYYISTLNSFAQSFANLMNGTNGVTDTDTARTMFATDTDEYDADGKCTYRSPVTASNIRISNEWMADPTMIGQNFNPDTGDWTLSLNGTNVNKLLLALDKSISIGNGEFNGSIYDYPLFVDNRFANDINFCKEQYDLYKGNAKTLLDTRDGISGVSETEEGINMLTYQKWFNSSSRMLTSLDDLLDKLINSTGRCGL